METKGIQKLDQQLTTQVDQNGIVHGAFWDRKRWKNGYFTAASEP